jgi:hypothetical protein
MNNRIEPYGIFKISDFKNPFIYISLILIIIFFIPLPKVYNAVKISVAIMVIAYVARLMVFKKRRKDSEKLEEEQLKAAKKEMEESE